MNAKGRYRLLLTKCQDFANRLFAHIDEEVTPIANRIFTDRLAILDRKATES